MTEVEWNDNVYLDVYQSINNSGSDVFLYWGGRDSGKSYNVALKLVEKCLTADKFKCILIRKTADSVRDSQYALIESIIHDFGLESLFKLTVSPMEIRCVNGNKFICRGCDNPHNIKSVTDPTDAWYEEADKIDYSDYVTISTGLRSNDVQIQEWITFNPESDGDYENHWLYKIVGKNYNQTKTWTKSIKVGNTLKGFKEIEVKYTSCHTTFDDNPYCPTERKAKYMATAEGDDYHYTVYIHGMWGNREVKSPFLHGYNEERHVGKTTFNPNAQTYVLIDFNINPFSASIFNYWYDESPHLHQVDEIKLMNGTINGMSEAIKERLNDSIYSAEYGGDFMGAAGKIGRMDNKSLFKELQQELGVSWSQFRLVANPKHKSSREECFYFTKNFPDLKIGEHCKDSRRDYRMVEVDAYGQIIKQNRKNENQLADFLDNFRYLVHTFFAGQIENHKKGGHW